MDPHEVGQERANWTTELLAAYLGQQTGIQVTEETVRVYLHGHGYECLRPTWTDADAKRESKPITWEKSTGRGLVSRATGPEPLPMRDLVEADLWSRLPADVPELLTRLSRADLYLQDEVQFAFHPTRQPGLEPQGSARPTSGRSPRR